MSEPRLKAKLWVQAALRRCSGEGIAAVVARKGDEDAGAVLVRVNRGGEAGSEVFAQTRDAEGRPAWMRATGPLPVPEPQADAYIARACTIDADLWVIEIDDRQGRVPFLERVL